MECINCHKHKMYDIYNNIILKCNNCGWKIKKRKYPKYYFMHKNGINIPKNVLWNTTINRHKYKVKHSLNKQKHDDSDFRCDHCNEFIKLCKLCHQSPIGVCLCCGHTRDGSIYKSEYSCDSYGCA